MGKNMGTYNAQKSILYKLKMTSVTGNRRMKAT